MTQILQINTDFFYNKEQKSWSDGRVKKTLPVTSSAPAGCFDGHIKDTFTERLKRQHIHF